MDPEPDPYADRHAAGRDLAAHLTQYAGRDDVVVLGLARGGVPVAYEVALDLHLPLDVLTVRKLGVPGREEVAMGAIATGGVRVINRSVVEAADVGEPELDAVTERERERLVRRDRAYRGHRRPLEVAHRTAIVVDDGLATGATMRAAVSALRQLDAGTIVAAVPVAAARSCATLEQAVDTVVCPHALERFTAVGYWYDDFTPTSDDEVRRLLEQAPDR